MDRQSDQRAGWLACQQCAEFAGDERRLGQGARTEQGAATPAIISAAVRKVVSAWGKEAVDANKSARDKAKGAAARADVGGASQPRTGKNVVTLDMVKDRNVSDEELLNRFSSK